MTRFLLVAAGGALGSMARFGLGLLAARLAPNASWPLGTFSANGLGGLAMGLLVGWLAFRGGAHQESIRLFAAVGLLGGFTTLSTYAEQSRSLLADDRLGAAAGYVGGTLAACLVAVVLASLLTPRSEQDALAAAGGDE